MTSGADLIPSTGWGLLPVLGKPLAANRISLVTLDTYLFSTRSRKPAIQFGYIRLDWASEFAKMLANVDQRLTGGAR